MQEHVAENNTNAPVILPRRTMIRVIIATIVPQFAFGLSFAWIAVAPSAMRQSHWSPVVIEAVYALTPLSSAVTFLISGRLVAMISLRRLCWVGMSLLITGLAVAFIFPNEFTFIVFYAMLALGVGYGITLAASLAAAAQLFPRRIGTVGGALTAAYGLAAVVEVPVLVGLTTSYFWIDALRLVGVSATGLAVVALAFMPTFPPTRERPVGGIIPLRLLAHPRVLTGVLLIIVAVPLGSYALSQVGIYAQDLRLAAVVSTAAVITAAIANTSGRFTSGLLSDHIGVNRVILIIVLLDAIGGIALWRTSTAAVLLIGAGAVAFACGGLGGTVPRLATDARSDAFNAVSGLLFAAYALGSFIGPLLGSVLGGGSLAWSVLGSITTASLIITAVRMIQVSRSVRKSKEPTVPSTEKGEGGAYL
jgi:MFS transporter, OFA family, oxalate/formate antiporter